MFNRQHVYGTITGFRARTKDEREQDRNHLVEVDLEVPLTYDLADEILPAMARDLFDDANGSWVPKPEIRETEFNIAPPPQLMAIREHPDLDTTEVKIGQVTLRKVRAKKAEAAVLVLAFTCSWVLGDDKELTTMVRRLKTGVYLTFTEQEPKLDLQPPDQTVDGEVVESQPGLPTDGGEAPPAPKRRGRPKKLNPAPAATVAVLACPQCRTEVPAGVRVCPQCGADVPAGALPPSADEYKPADDTPTTDTVN